jgi:DNA-binding response OmpR family regulator
MHGFELSERIKRMGDVPIVILTADNSDDLRIQGMEDFAEDFIGKPFHNREVLARIQKILSRISDYSYADSPVNTIDSRLSVDLPHKRIILDGQENSLTPTEAKLLHVLLRAGGNFVTTDTLIARALPSKMVSEESLRVHMSRLRDKIQPKNERQYIHTERGLGYAFIPPDDSPDPKKVDSRLDGRLQAVS